MATLAHQFDINLLMKDAGLIAADGATAVSSVAKILDTGSAVAEYHADLVVDVTAIEIATGDEHYEIVVQGSSSSTFASAVTCLSSLRIGDGSALATLLGAAGVTVDDSTGRYILPFRNEKNGTIYRYVRVWVSVTGAIATGINFTAYVAPRVP